MRALNVRSFVLLALITTIVSVVVVKTARHTNAMNAEPEPSTNENPLLKKWEGPYGGVPPFDRVQIPLFKPALEAAMAEQLAEIDVIAKNPAPPDFQNTIAALERSGGTFDRVTTVYGVWGATMATPEYQAVQREMAPRLAAFNDQITQNEPHFKRIDADYNSPAKARRTPEQPRVAQLITEYSKGGLIQ